MDGIEPKDVSVDLTSEDMASELFQAVHFPTRVDRAKAKAEYRNGVLTVTVPAAQDAPARAGKSEAA